MLDLPEGLRLILIAIISYVMGSIPTAYLVARQRGINIFEVGSGNMGATNVTRSMGMKWGLVVWFFDSLKGILAIAVSVALLPENMFAATAISAIMAIIGHNWSIFATILTGTVRGGKGAAIWFGTMFAIAPIPVLVGMLLMGGLVIAITRYVSLGVLAMCALSMGWLFVLIGQGSLPAIYSLYCLAVIAMIVIRFWENIQRLVAGTERRLGDPA